MQLHIRPLNEDEIPNMVDVWVKAGLPYRPKGRDSIDSLRIQWRADPELFIGAFEGDLMVGVVLATDERRKAWINRLAVLPDARRRGVAKEIVAYCEKMFHERGRGIFCVLIESDNAESEELFEGLGYKHEKDIHYFAKRDSNEF
jgi:ribosomal protein S18 acetylase RimI-like enzyme